MAESESTPLLEPPVAQYRGDGQRINEESQSHRGTDASDQDDDAGSFFIRGHKFSKKRFWWSCALGILAIIALHLSFLPRTSLSKDYRRWHGLRLTKSDIKRNYLIVSGIGKYDDDGANEDHMNWWLSNFTALNAREDVNLLAMDNEPLTSYITGKFKEFGLNPKSFSYDASDLKKPLSSSIRLYHQDSELYSSNLLEPSCGTPAFYSFGKDGSFQGKYVFVNRGTLEDFELVKSNGIDLKDKVVISFSKVMTPAEKAKLAEHYGAKALVDYSGVESSNENLETVVLRDSVDSNILAVPASIKSIQPILNTLGKPSLDSPFKDWPFSPLGADNFDLQVNCQFDKSKRKLTNIVGTFKGVLNDGDVIVGAARDSLTASNPLSGHAIMFEIIRHFKQLQIVGWKPLRTIKFVSWDASRSDSLGSKALIKDGSFSRNPVLAYINIDGDAVSGSKFEVDADPLFNSVIKDVSKYCMVPKSKKSKGAKGLTSLFKYWSDQDGNKINNVLGESIARVDASVFQTQLCYPTINIKFSNNPDKDAFYAPNSNWYSYKWLFKKQIDGQLLLHGSLARFLGFLTIDLAEREVAHYKTKNHFKTVGALFRDLARELKPWHDKKVNIPWISKYYLYTDLKESLGSNSPHVVLSDVLDLVRILLRESIPVASSFDNYALEVEESLTKDYPWYKYYKKLKVLAQFKLTNYKLLHFESYFKLSENDFAYLNTKTPSKNLLFGVPRLPVTSTHNYRSSMSQGIFPLLKEAIETDNFELAVKYLTLFYDKTRALMVRIS